MQSYTCNFCGEEFESYPSSNTSFCSRKCWKKYREPVQRQCCNSNCSKSTTVNRSDIRLNNYCSIECRTKANSGEKSVHYKDAKVQEECVICGESFSYYHSRDRTDNGTPQFCSNSCMATGFSDGRFSKENNPSWNGGKAKLECVQCGEEYEVTPAVKDSSSYCSYQCRSKYFSENMTGSNSPAWSEHNIGSHYYGANWNDIRQKVLQRDNGCCVICGRGEEELGQSPDVHHIKPLRRYDNPEDANELDNLVTLCRKHHGIIENWCVVPLDVADRIN